MTSRAYVFIDGLESNPIICGVVELDPKTNIGKFRYGQSYLQRGDAFPLDPIHLPLISEQFINSPSHSFKNMVYTSSLC